MLKKIKNKEKPWPLLTILRLYTLVYLKLLDHSSLLIIINSKYDNKCFIIYYRVKLLKIIVFIDIHIIDKSICI